MPELGLIVSGQIGHIESCDWKNYAQSISAFMKINHKYNVMALIKANMDWIEYPFNCPGIQEILPEREFGDRDKRDLKNILAIQAFSLAFELTENLAAICYAYVQAVNHGFVYLPLSLRDFGIRRKLERLFGERTIEANLADAESLYQAALSDEPRLIEYFGSSEMSGAQREDRRNVLGQIVDYREKYNRWYNLYKHTQSTIPLQINHPSYSWSIVHRIPDSISVSDVQFECADEIHLPEIRNGAVKITPIETDNLLSPMELVGDANTIGSAVLRIWQEMRRYQHKRLFNEVIA